MANRFFGEHSATVDGERYTLRCDFNALIAFEDATGEDALQAFEALEGGQVGLRQMRAIMLALLQHHHPEITEKEAGVILSKNVDLLQKVIAASSPEQGDKGSVGNGPKPRNKKPAKG